MGINGVPGEAWKYGEEEVEERRGMTGRMEGRDCDTDYKKGAG